MTSAILTKWVVKSKVLLGRRHLVESLELRRQAEEDGEFKAIRRGWFFVGDKVKQDLLALWPRRIYSTQLNSTNLLLLNQAWD